MLDQIEIGLCWGTLQRAGLSELIELAGRYAFPTLCVPPHIFYAALQAGQTEQALRRQLADAGVRVRVIDCIAAGLPGMPPGESIVDGKRIPQFSAQQCLDVAQALEAPIINVSLYHSRKVPVAEMAGAIGAICRQAGRGFQIVLEFYPESGIRDLHQAHAIAQACGEANCAVMLDSWHFARSGGALADIGALPPGAIGAFQLSDRATPPPDAEYVPMTGRRLPGEGALPLAGILAAAMANSPGITAEIEVFSEALRNLPLQDAASRTANAIAAWRNA